MVGAAGSTLGAVELRTDQAAALKSHTLFEGKREGNNLAASRAKLAEKGFWAAGLCSRCSKIKPVIKSAAIAASPKTQMWESPRTTAQHSDGGGGGSSAFGHRGGCTGSRLDHRLDL